LRIAVNTTTIESAPIFVAAERRGRAVQLIGGKIPRLLDGSADAATNAETQALHFSLGHPELRIILTVAECGYRIICRNSAGIRQAADLRGKTVGTVKHTSSHFYIVKTLRHAGLREEDATVVDLPLAAMPDALKRGAVDALSIWEPVAQSAITAIEPDVTVLEAPALFRERFNLNTTTAVLADPVKRVGLVDFVRAVIDAAALIGCEPQAAWPLLSAKIDLAEPTIARLWRQFRFPATLPDDLLPLLIEEERWLAPAQDRPPRSPETLASLIDDSVLREARAAPRA
jgi:NitT/TauT family transport system substrate-binding protein